MFYKKGSFYVIIFYAINIANLIINYLHYIYSNIKLDSNFYLTLSIFILSTILLLVYFLLRLKSISVYAKYIKKIDKSNMDHFVINPGFPEEDELGRLGHYLNKLLNTLKDFDDLKKEKIRLNLKTIKKLLNMIKEPMFILDDSFKIDFYNNEFAKEFKIGNDKRLEEQSINNIITGESFDSLIKEIGETKTDSESIKKDIECSILNNVFQINFEIYPVFYGNYKNYIFLADKKHKNIFSK